MTPWSHISMERDRLDRLHVARCTRCGQMLAAGKERRTVEIAAARHHCHSTRDQGEKRLPVSRC